MSGKDRPPPYNPYPNDIPQPYSRASAHSAGYSAGGYRGPPPPQPNYQYQQQMQQQHYGGDAGGGYQQQQQYRGNPQSQSRGGGRGGGGGGGQRQRQPAGKTGSLARIQRTARRVKESSEISLCIKYSLFFANFIFWVSYYAICMYFLKRQYMYCYSTCYYFN